ncbi:unannotated protein [freshwater metagenome]|uniref:Unannotated protein n=1 Tax=freshwater metagenome TaxID=449393 RepID=A0A6J7NPR5_9ZZZZ|nr:FkbM family methyltransferase [Actinomycetota bacterium]MSW90806.1 FkbM family methyltransferase [Actinomycetota bacterium]MSY71188.1 FkbM family methyltransferase [Actinomycetota bacterium]
MQEHFLRCHDAASVELVGVRGLPQPAITVAANEIRVVYRLVTNVGWRRCLLLHVNTSVPANLHVVEAPLGASSGEVTLADTGIDPRGYRVGDSVGLTDHVFGQVECVPHGDLVDRLGIDPVGLLKVDIEGSELEVFRASGPRTERVHAIATGLHDRYRPRCTRAFINTTASFDHEMVRGEDTLVWRAPSPTPAISSTGGS